MVADDGEYAIVAAESLMKRAGGREGRETGPENRMENLMDRIIDEDCEWLLEERRVTGADMNPLLRSFLTSGKSKRAPRQLWMVGTEWYISSSRIC